MFDTLAKMGLTGWPLVAAIGICVFGWVSLFNGWPTFNWPWQRDIYHHCDCDKHDEEEE